MQEKLNKLLETKNEKYIKIKRNSRDDATKDFKEKELYYFDKENINNYLTISTILEYHNKDCFLYHFFHAPEFFYF